MGVVTLVFRKKQAKLWQFIVQCEKPGPLGWNRLLNYCTPPSGSLMKAEFEKLQATAMLNVAFSSFFELPNKGLSLKELLIVFETIHSKASLSTLARRVSLRIVS